MKIFKTLEQAMPTVMAGEYVPEICKTLDTRRRFIDEQQPQSRVITAPTGCRVLPYVDLRMSVDTGNRYWFYAVDSKVNDLLYVMHLNPLKLRFKRGADSPAGLWKFAMYQGSVWRAEGSELKIGNELPSVLFWKLFNQHRNWFSDISQSKDGKRFWVRRIAEALSKGLLVYAVHFDEKSGIEIDKAVPISFGDSLEHYWTYEDVKDFSGMYWRFAIVHP